MSFKDHFSKQAPDYAKFRPKYPPELFEYLGGIAPQQKMAWDCATGNGQAAVALAFRIAPAIDEVVNNRYYRKVVGPFWPPERTLIEKFEQLPFPFPETETPRFQMSVQWKLEHLIGYLRTWSATQRFIAANGRDPLEEIAAELGAAWGDTKQSRRVVWPLTVRVGIRTT